MIHTAYDWRRWVFLSAGNEFQSVDFDERVDLDGSAEGSAETAVRDGTAVDVASGGHGDVVSEGGEFEWDCGQGELL